jgi:dienelactone hydrolase
VNPVNRSHPGAQALSLRAIAKCTEETLHIAQSGFRIHAKIHWPEKREYCPAIVMDCGFSGTQHAVNRTYAQHYVDAGFAVLQFDHLYFGNSGGAPRQQFDLKLQIRTLGTVHTYLRKMVGVDGNRVGIWGACLGAHRALRLASLHKDIKATVALAPTPVGKHCANPRQVVSLLKQEGFETPTLSNLNSSPQFLTAWTSLLRFSPANTLEKIQGGVMAWTTPQHPTVPVKKLNQSAPKFFEYHALNCSPEEIANEKYLYEITRETTAFFRQYL